MRITVTVESAEHSADVLLDCDDQTTVASLASALADTLPGSSADLRLAGRSVDPGTSVADLGLRDGERVGLGRDLPAPPEPPAAGWVLDVVSGPDSGGVFALPIGEHVLGRSGALSFADSSLSRQHCRITVGADGTATVTDLGSSNGTRLDGVTLAANEPVPIALGQLLGVGHSVVVIRPARRPDAATEAAEPGFAHFLRPPRLLPHQQQARVEIPRPPGKKATRRIPWIAILMPLLFGGVMAVLMGPRYLLFALMSPLMMAANYFSDQRSGAKDHRQERIKYDEELKASQARLTELVAAEQERRRDELLDAAETFLTCVLPGKRLWERRRHDADNLLLRVGTADLPSSVEITGETEGQPERRLHGVPAGVPLGEAGVVGIAGPDAAVAGLLRWLIVQLCAYHPTRDLALTLITAPGESHWQWVRWLPHLRPGDPDGSVASVGNDRESIAAQVNALVGLLAARKEAVQGRSGMASGFPAQVLVVHGYRDVRTVVGLAQLLDEGPAYGIYAICTDAEERLLPERCTVTVLASAERPDFGSVRRTGHPAVEDVLLEGVSPAWCERVARAISPLVDVGGDSEDSTLPESARLLEVMGLDPPEPDAIRARWALEPRSTTMTLGIGLEGAFGLDLRRDGPHGLIAGTTGSGKSELLQTMIAALAIGNRPDELNFVLVDYKGGSAFKDCVRLPHTVGMVTDLDNRLVGRALTSLGAELKRREHILADAGVKDIEDYQDLAARTPGGLPALPRLAIVIDEFASLARELPDFVAGLVNIAQRGRSLGIHLVLATQRPTGVVSPEIRANTNMRLSLRVTDTAESTDVLEAPDAARIAKSTPGRGYARLGHGALIPFQSGRVSGRRPGAAITQIRPPFATRVSWGELGYAMPEVPLTLGAVEEIETDLAVLVDAIAAAAAAEGLDAQRSPWLPALPEMVEYDRLGIGAPDSERVALAFGIEDLPDEQRQRTRSWDLAREGHLLVMGAARSGRSQLLRVLAASAGAYPVDEVHLYGLDFGNGVLQSLEALPHCGAVIGRSQVERAIRFLSRLRAEMARRQRILTTSGYADVVEQRAHTQGADRLPHVVVLLDRWEGFMATLGELDSGAHLEAVLATMREGASLGIHLAITGDRLLGAGRISSLSENKHVLRLPERNDATLFGLRERDLPEHHAAGRMLSSATGTETQVAILAADDSAPAQAEVLRRIAAEARSRPAPRSAPFRVDVLPATVTVPEALDYPLLDAGQLVAPVGIGGDDLALRGFDLSRPGSTFIVAGPARSGRSTLLRFTTERLLAQGAEVVIAAPRLSVLRDLAGSSGVRAVITDPQAELDVWQSALAVPTDQWLVVVFDDAEGLRDCAAAPLLIEAMRGERGASSVILAGHIDSVGSGFTGWQVEARKARRGVLLSPQQVTDGDLIGASLSRNHVGGAPMPGRALFHDGGGDVVAVAVPYGGARA